MPGYFGSPDDPDRQGIGLKSRARDNRRRYQQQEADDYTDIRQQVPGAALYGPLRHSTGRRYEPVLRDPNWEAMFQAWDEAGVDRVRQDPRQSRDLSPSISALLKRTR